MVSTLEEDLTGIYVVYDYDMNKASHYVDSLLCM